MLERRDLFGASVLIAALPSLAVAQAPRAAADRLNELGPENESLLGHVGLWDVTETVWSRPGADPVVTTGLVAERRMIGSFLQEFLRPAADIRNTDIKRIDYVSYMRVEGRWKYVSIETRAPVGIMPAFSFDRGTEKGLVFVHEPFALVGEGTEPTGQMIRMDTVFTRLGPDHDVKNQHFTLADGTGTVWLAHRYEYARRLA